MDEPDHKRTAPEITDPTVVADPDLELEELTERALRALAEDGITVQDLLDSLPAVREEVMRETYGPAFMEEVATAFAAYHPDAPQGL